MNSASLAISPELGNPLEVRGKNTKYSSKKTVGPLVAANSEKLLTLVKPSHPGDAKALGTRPLAFIENKGQFDKQVKFQVSGNGRTLWLTDNGIVFDFLRAKSIQDSASKSEVQQSKLVPSKLEVAENPSIEKPAVRDMERHVVFQDFVGANHNSSVETKGLQEGIYNYLTGSEPSEWRTQIHGFSEVVYHDIWNGVDLRLFGNGQDLEQEFIVKPGANVSQIGVAYRGIDGLDVAKDGSLLIPAATGQMRETAPRIYQEIEGRRVSVQGEFKLSTPTSYSFDVPTYDLNSELVIDPTLLYSTFLGGSAGNSAYNGNAEVATGIGVDSLGNAVVAGFTSSLDFPVTPGAFQTTHNCCGQIAFVTKLNPTGSALVYSTYLGHTSSISGIAVDSTGNAYVTGGTSDTYYGNRFPTTPSAYWPTDSNHQCAPFDIFLTKLNPSGDQLLYSTCLNAGPGSNTAVNAIAVDSHGRAFITGYRGLGGSGIPTTANAYQPSYPGGRGTSAFLTAFDTAASGTVSLVYSTYFGIPNANFYAYGTTGNGIAIDPFGNAYITGYAGDSLPVTAGAFQTSLATGVMCNPYGGQQWVCPDAFIAKLNPNVAGSQSLIYSTYLGGPGNDSGSAIAVDASGNAFVTGFTQSASFPVTAGAFQSTPSCGSNLFVTKLNAGGSKLIYSTYLSGNCYANNNAANGIAVDSLGNAYVAGGFRAQAQSTFPVTADAFQSSFAKLTGDFQEAFLTKLNPTGSGLVYSSYFGGGGDDVATTVAVDQIGDTYIAGHTSSANLPTRNAFQLNMKGTGDAFVAKFSTGAGGAMSIIGVYPSQVGNTGPVTPTIIGSGFHYGATATLNCSGSTSITGSNPTVSVDGRTISATFSLNGQPPGSCSVSVTNLDASSVSQQAALTVLPGGSEDIQVNLFGRHTLGGGFPSTFFAGYSNSGTVDSRPFRVWISFNNFLAWNPPPGIKPSSAGQLNGTTYVGFDIPSVPAGTSGWIPIQLTAPSNLPFHYPFQVQVWEVGQ